jgi:AGCS family alanine or glycine:cation symporter
MEEIIGVLNDIVWSDALIVLCLGTGLYFSIRTRFLDTSY